MGKTKNMPHGEGEQGARLMLRRKRSSTRGRKYLYFAKGSADGTITPWGAGAGAGVGAAEGGGCVAVLVSFGRGEIRGCSSSLDTA